MTARVLDGAAVAAGIRARVAARVRDLAAEGIVPRLEVILVGEDPASLVYVGSKAKACQEVGVRSSTQTLPASTPGGELAARIRGLNADPDVDGILLQMPLPAPLDGRHFLDLIDPGKDVDGFHPTNVGLLQQGRPAFVPCTPAGVMELLDASGVALSGAHAVVVGRSDIVGKPMAVLLLQRHATVTVCHSRTRDLPGVCRLADVLVAAVGKPALVGGDCVKPGAVVIDVGVNRVEDAALVRRLYPGNDGRQAQLGKRGYTLVGDVDFTAASEVASAITPVPGGIGPLTIAGLLVNTLRAACQRRGLPC
ncbi:MAG TPA: bifunctional 5,10-methylenetetrahydrofolate dehydrogenase/5,10-methenyltetrahydrofolate cyclohydrolase [Thermoanaerobaculaceae bacterium]|nr:bifunctional 5,10-methylenetetrahydrofolate dehydrogenase/5,10-methenyltetrahydrofolate cyclohydrolase [Thermoanaerobaculaceae bacterium]HPS78100.1 bifunctional 5,10-methylenetetrahydrofolate dehydrogenase/5,10-methenyltetrahydrofolate cyclohydrolase [Thermoanaerobaculaceae bacterium]